MKTLITILIILLTSPLWAADYYVSNTGDDTATGLVGFPWAHHPWDASATDTANGTALQPGDTVSMNRGDTWTTTFLIEDSGSAGGGVITMGAYGSGNLPIMIGPTTTLNSGWTQHSGDVYKQTITHNGNDVGWLWEGSVSEANAMTMNEDTSLAAGEFFFDSSDANSGVLYVYQTGGGDPGGNDILYSSDSYVIKSLPANESEYLKFEYIEVWGGGVAGIYMEADPAGGIPVEVEFSNCKFMFNGSSENAEVPGGQSASIIMYAYGNVDVLDNDFIKIASYGMFLKRVDEPTIQRNEVSYFGYSNSSWISAIKLINVLGDTTYIDGIISENYIHDAGRSDKANGIWIDVDVINSTVKHNWVEGTNRGIFFENSTHDSVAFGNVLIGNRSGIKMGDIVNTGVYDNGAYHNTIVDSTLHSFFLDYDAAGTNSVKNNISINPGTYHVQWSDDAFGTGTLSSDYNLFYETTGDSFITKNYGVDPPTSTTTDPVTYAEWKALNLCSVCNFDANSISSDPLFEDSANDKYWLKGTSPAIGAQTDLGYDCIGPSSTWPDNVVTGGCNAIGAYFGPRIRGVSF